MGELLIFGGTTEGRKLAEFCEENKVRAIVSVTTDYGAELLNEGKYVKILNGKLNENEISALISESNFSAVIDATHPYAVLATENIRSACKKTNVKYYRLIRESNPLFGTVVNSLNDLVNYLNSNNKTVLSTLGSKEMPVLSGVDRCFERVWLRVLPADGIREMCEEYGFDGKKLILGKGPFTVEENIMHLRKSGAQILVTKESGAVGGYPEKVQAASQLGIELVTIKRPEESGNTIEEIESFILRELQ